MSDKETSPELKGEIIVIPSPRGDISFAARRITEAADAVFGDRNALISALPRRVVEPGPWLTQAVIAANLIDKDVDLISVRKSFLNAASIGLMVGSAFGHCWPVPFKDNKDGGIRKAQLIIGYQGYLELGYRTGFLKRVNCNVVMKDEEFESWADETGNHIRHKMPIDRDTSRENEITAAYCTWTTGEGYSDVVIVSRAQILKAKPSHFSEAWKGNFAAMVMKIPIRRAAKVWRKGPTGEITQASTLDEQAERGEVQEALQPMPRVAASQNMDRIVEKDICGNESEYDRLKELIVRASNDTERDAAFMAVQNAAADRKISQEDAGRLSSLCDELPL